ncbi:voltage-gated potassium channel subunit beta-1 [Striga asiatica]|uniref:Voltage-gated potassium channel subunit beta-1 n=1 Tax=Striga asiatica TaxID=4170 RepID=A0A5A7Q9T9_STRAF|nr:voltage-gated potassium channel subunit beta-1 [Striga asiatica]
MASSSCSFAVPTFSCDSRSSTRVLPHRHFTRLIAPQAEGGRSAALRWKRKVKRNGSFVVFSKSRQENALQYKKLGDSDLVISEITLGTNTEKEAHEQLSYSFERGINALDTAEVYPIPLKKETQGRTDLYIGRWLKSQSRDKITLTYSKYTGKLFRPDRYVPLFGEYFYTTSNWRSSVPVAEQLRGFQELIDQGKNQHFQDTGYCAPNANLIDFHFKEKDEHILFDPAYFSQTTENKMRQVRYIGVSNETSYGVMEFVHAAKVEGLPKIVSIQNNYSMLVRCKFELDLAEVCHPNNCNIGLLAYSPLAGGALSGKYLDIHSEAAKRGRLNLFPGYMERYNKSMAKDVTAKYADVAKKHGMSLVELALAFTRDRPFVTSSIIGATTMDQLKEDIDAFLTTERPLPPEVMSDVEYVFKRNKDPAID